MGLRRKKRSRFRRRHGAHSRMSQYLSVGAVIAVTALVSTFLLNQPLLRSAEETFTNSFMSVATLAGEISVIRTVDPDW